MNITLAIGLVILGTIIGSFGALMLKLGSNKLSFNPIKLIKNWKLILGCFLYFLSTIPFIIALKFADLSLLYPFVATSYIWVTILSIYALKEKMNVWKWAGITAIIIGVIFIGLGA